MEEGIELPLDRRTLARYAEIIRNHRSGELRAADISTPELRLFGTWDLASYYAPLDHLDSHARVVVVAICPPLGVAIAAHAAARDALADGLSREEAWRRAAIAARPAGTFGTNLGHMLDGLGLADALGVATVRDDFGASFGRIQFTYCVRYPVLVNDRDYTGRRPQLLRFPPLRRFVGDLLAPQLATVPDAIVIPLGRVAGEAVASLIEEGRLELGRCLLGLPNPSGANGHREEDYERSREELRLQLAVWFQEHPAGRGSEAEAG